MLEATDAASSHMQHYKMIQDAKSYFACASQYNRTYVSGRAYKLRLACPGNLRYFQIFTFLFTLPPLNILAVHTQQYQEKRTTVAVAV